MDDKEKKEISREFALLLLVGTALLILGVFFLQLGLKEARGACPPLHLPWDCGGMEIIGGICGIILGLLAFGGSLWGFREIWFINRLQVKGGKRYRVITDLPGHWGWAEIPGGVDPLSGRCSSYHFPSWFLSQADDQELEKLKAAIKKIGAYLEEVTGYTNHRTEGQFPGVFWEEGESPRPDPMLGPFSEVGKKGITQLLVQANSNQIEHIQKLPHVEGIIIDEQDPQ